MHNQERMLGVKYSIGHRVPNHVSTAFQDMSWGPLSLADGHPMRRDETLVKYLSHAFE